MRKAGWQIKGAELEAISAARFTGAIVTALLFKHTYAEYMPNTP